MKWGRWVCLALCMGAVLSGCGKHQSAEHRAAPKPAKNASATVHDKLPGNQPAPLSKAAQLSRESNETVESAAPAESATHSALLTAVAATVAAATPVAGAAPAATPTQWQEGANYTRLVPAQPTAVPPGQIEVLEFFWYACPHCYALDPQLDAWRKSKAAYVTFSRVHVLWSENHRNLARLFFTLESMGKIDQLHTDIFKEIHLNNNPLLGPDPDSATDAERVQTAFVVKHGVSADAFREAYHSFSVDNAMQRADQLVQRYRVTAVPTFVINGKYITDVGMAGSQERLISLINDLAAQEHKH